MIQATVSELPEIFADSWRYPHKKTALYMRRLREAGMLPETPGGKIIQATAEHAATLMLALLAGGNAAHAVEAAKTYGSLVEVDDRYLTDFGGGAVVLEKNPNASNDTALEGCTRIIQGIADFDYETWEICAGGTFHYHMELSVTLSKANPQMTIGRTEYIRSFAESIEYGSAQAKSNREPSPRHRVVANGILLAWLGCELAKVNYDTQFKKFSTQKEERTQ